MALAAFSQTCQTVSWLVNLPPPNSPRNKALSSGLIKHWFPSIRPYYIINYISEGESRGGVGWPAMITVEKAGKQISKTSVLQQEQALFPSAILNFWKNMSYKKGVWLGYPPSPSTATTNYMLLGDSNLNLHLLPLMGRGNNPKFRLPHLTKFQQLPIFRKLPTSMKTTIMNGFQARCIYIFTYIYIYFYLGYNSYNVGL